MNGKGDTPRKVDRKKWDDCPLWDNMKNKPHDPWDDFPEVHGPADEFTFLSPKERAALILKNYKNTLKSQVGMSEQLFGQVTNSTFYNKELLAEEVMKKYKNALKELKD